MAEYHDLVDKKIEKDLEEIREHCRRANHDTKVARVISITAITVITFTVFGLIMTLQLLKG